MSADTKEKFLKLLEEYKQKDGAYNVLDCAYDLFYVLEKLSKKLKNKRI